MEVSLRPLDADTLDACWELKISDQQMQEAFFDESTQAIILRALKEVGLTRLVIYDELTNTAVGYAHIRNTPPSTDHDIGVFFIDERFQAKGYGMAALKQIIADLFARPDCQKITLTYMDFNEAAVFFYRKVGFVVVENDNGFIRTELVRDALKQ